MRIFDIQIYRDGGSVEFRVERDGHTKHVWLDTPFKGEPRALRVDSVAVISGVTAVDQLADDIEEWLKSLSPTLLDRAYEALAHKGFFYNPDAEKLKAIDISRVLMVRDYLNQNYRA
jgi:hypothetical protein